MTIRWCCHADAFLMDEMEHDKSSTPLGKRKHDKSPVPLVKLQCDKSPTPLDKLQCDHEPPATPGLLLHSDKFTLPLISIGPFSDAMLDHIGMQDNTLLRLHILLGTVRSSRWEVALTGPEWNLRPDQAAALAIALLKDIQGTRDYTINVVKVSIQVANIVLC